MAIARIHAEGAPALLFAGCCSMPVTMDCSGRPKCLLANRDVHTSSFFMTTCPLLFSIGHLSDATGALQSHALTFTGRPCMFVQRGGYACVFTCVDMSWQTMH
eukprot:976974-Pelagomonas_calceolata.AAC.1